MGREIILVVDDNHEVADFTGGSILPSLGYESLVAYGGRSALDIIRKHHRQISLILLDLQMPDLDGLTLLQKVIEEGYNVPAILTTAHGSEQIAAEAFRLGVMDYLIKPIDVEVLSAAISRALAGNRLQREKDLLTQKLKEQVSWLTALLDVGRGVTSTLDVDVVLKRIVDACVRLTKADQGFLALIDYESSQLQLRVVKNIDESKIETFRLPVSDPLIAQALKTKSPIRKDRANKKEPPLKVSTGILVHSLLHVPLFSKGKALGVLSVNNHSKLQHFTEKDESLLLSLADYAAVALENASLYQQAQSEIVERKKIQQALAESEERFELAVQGANDGIWDWDLRTNRVFYSPRWKSMLGFGEDEISDSPEEWFKRIHPDHIARVKIDIAAHFEKEKPNFVSEHRILHKDGSYRWVLSRGQAVWNEKGIVYRISGSQSDITDRKNAEEKLYHDAFHDSLTNLPNRALFTKHLTHAIDRAKRKPDFIFTVMFLDLDRFKDINDSLGHLVGDELLVEVAKTLRDGLRVTDTVARFGGDELIILLEDVGNLDNVKRVTEWIEERFSRPFHVMGHEVFISTSIGIVLSGSYENAEDMIRDADIAMYEAKERGRARAVTFDPSMRDRIMKRLSLESDLRKALTNEELTISYLPVVSLDSGQLLGFEALVRWQHPERGLIYPREFIPLAEDTGMIVDVDQWVLGEASRQIQEWCLQYKLGSNLKISVNISSKTITAYDLIENIVNILNRTELAASQLKLEISEQTIMQYSDMVKDNFAKLDDLGVQIQIDDFGISYSSLERLSSYPINALKIDQTFVGKVSHQNSHTEIVKAIITLTRRLNVGVIAEGIENKEQLDILKSLGCNQGQGFFFSEPLDKTSATTLLEKIKNEGEKFTFEGVI